MLRVAVAVAVWTAVAPLAWADGAAVEGVVAMGKAAPPPVVAPRYPLAATYEVAPPDPPVAVVFLEAGTAPTAAPEATVAQRGYQFRPGLVAVARGTTVAFPNLDDEYHSVFSYSKAKRFDLGRYRRDEGPARVTFDTPGLVRLYCEIHDHMRGAVLVVDTPHFTTTGPDGRYRLEGLPSGSYTLTAWVDEDDVRTATVELRANATARVDFPSE